MAVVSTSSSVPPVSGAVSSQVPLPSAARSSRRPGDVAGRFLARWASPPREQEKRQCRRRSLRTRLALLDAEGNTGGQLSVIPAECLNIGDGGLYAIVPMGYGVAIGNRYTFRLTVGELGPEPGGGQLVSQQGEVVRAELLLGEDGYADRIGIGVRLFGPRSGMVPMPPNA